jgi:predicted AlkP superfamily pyrophosphatase or phosphodiesterase
MKNLIPSLLPQIKNNRLPGLELEPEFIYPSYNSLSLSNLPHSICNWLGASGLGCPALDQSIVSHLDGPFDQVVLFLLDGLGLYQFQNMALQSQTVPECASTWQGILEDACLAPLTSVQPSTTAAALTTLWTGYSPASHGVVGYELWLREYGMISNMISFAPASFVGDPGGLRKAGFTPDGFIPLPTLGAHLAHHKLQANALMYSAIANSPLSQIHLAESKVIPWRTLADLFVTLGNLLSAAQHPSYTYIYWPDIDTLSHTYGPEDERVQLEFSSFSWQLSHFLENYRRRPHPRTLFLITADHGLIHTPRDPLYELRHHPEFASWLVMPPAGESRLTYLYIRSGCEEFVKEYIHNNWADQFLLLPSSQAVQSGLFGAHPHHPALSSRVGDWILISRRNAHLWWQGRDDPMLGRHGGLSPEEMLVPLVLFEK